MAKLRIGVVYDIWWSEDDDEEEKPEKPEKPEKGRKKKPPEKETHQEVHAALREAGHAPFYQVLDGEAESLKGLADSEADLYFNLTESWAGDDTKDICLASYFDLLGKHYTGSGYSGLYLAQDKALAKKIFAFHGIHTPYFATVNRGRLEWSHDIQFPVIVKPAREDGSIGIEFGAVVGSIKELMERIDALHDKFTSPVLIEEYIEGREIYVAVLGNENPEALPIVELDLSAVPEGKPKIAGTEVKWHHRTRLYRQTKPFFPEDLDEETEKRIKETAIDAFQALQLRDYGRIDMRLSPDGKVHVLEVNPNPWIASKAEFAMAAKKAGRDYPALINEIVELATARYGR